MTHRQLLTYLLALATIGAMLDAGPSLCTAIATICTFVANEMTKKEGAL